VQAYNLFTRRGGGDGHALEDWINAERELCWPSAEVVELDGKYAVKVALAGFEPNEIAVTATPREVIVKASHEHRRCSDEKDARILSIEAALGSYVSAAGTYDTILGGNAPLMLMGGGDADVLSVRCYVDEILIQRLALDADTPARLFVRGTDVSLPLQFVRVQPYVSPKIELSSNRTERVDVYIGPARPTP
jgi:hypothetical protein